MQAKAIDRAQARAFYDRFGVQQDRQGWYEDAALDRLVEAADLANARSVVELGCGTGRLAARLLGDELPATASYRGIEISATMAELSRRRLAIYGDRAEVDLLRGTGPPPIGERSCDRLFATYVLDLLGEEEIRAILEWAAEEVAAGKLCLAGLTAGNGVVSRVVMSCWAMAFRLAPLRVGGCRPMRIAERLDAACWKIELEEVVVSWGIASEVLVARRVGPAEPPIPTAPKA